MSALLSDVELSVLTAVIARGELLTNGDAQRLRGHIEALGEKYAAAMAVVNAAIDLDSITAGTSFQRPRVIRLEQAIGAYRDVVGR